MARWTIFLPALLLYPIWITIGFREDMFTTSISIYYPMMLAMVVGSMIAGSTPLGGGIVAFPVSVLVLGFSPTEGRDFSLMIQSVGMTAASFLIFCKKKHLLEGCEDLISKFVLMSVIGIIIGFELVGAASPYVVNIVYTTLVACLVLVFGYRDFFNHRLKPVSTNVPSDDNVVETTVQVLASGSGIEEDASTISLPKRLNTELGLAFFLEHLLLLVFAIAGGVLSSQIGIGADTSFYFYGSFLNAIMSRNIGASSSQTMCDNSLTAVSVIVMACTSVVGSILRITTQQASELAVTREVYSALYACSPIVVLGAPLGSLFLTPPNQQRLKYVFYSIGILQLFSFGVIKIGNDLTAWIAIVGVISAVSGSIFMHYMISDRRLQKDNTMDIETV